MKRVVVYFMFLLILLHAFSKVLTVVYWKLHQDSIAQTKCVNKDRPTMKCKGKCQLMKMVENKSNHNKNTTPPPIEKLVNPSQYIVADYPDFNLQKNVESEDRTKLHYVSKVLLKGFFIESFHPPETPAQV